MEWKTTGDDYPLPRSAMTGNPWWVVNFGFCLSRAYSEWQSGKGMAEIIPVARWLQDSGFRPQRTVEM